MFKSQVDDITPLYDHISIEVFPFLRPEYSAPNSSFVEFDVSWLGSNNGKDWNLLWERRVVNYVQCYFLDSQCLSFFIVDEPELMYAHYKVEVFIPNATGGNLGDFLFEWEANNPEFAKEDIAIRMIYSVASLVVAVWFSYRMSKENTKLWTVEQWWGLILLYCLVLFNNPIYPAGVFTASAAFPVLFAVFEAFFMCAWIFYCLLYLDMVR